MEYSVNNARITNVGYPVKYTDAVNVNFLKSWGSGIPRIVHAASSSSVTNDEIEQYGCDGITIDKLEGKEILVTNARAGIYRVKNGKLQSERCNGLISVQNGRDNIGTLWILHRNSENVCDGNSCSTILRSARYVGIDPHLYSPTMLKGGDSYYITLPSHRVINLHITASSLMFSNSSVLSIPVTVKLSYSIFMRTEYPVVYIYKYDCIGCSKRILYGGITCEYDNINSLRLVLPHMILNKIMYWSLSLNVEASHVLSEPISSLK
jgi:hypothetical protein